MGVYDDVAAILWRDRREQDALARRDSRRSTCRARARADAPVLRGGLSARPLQERISRAPTTAPWTAWSCASCWWTAKPAPSRIKRPGAFSWPVHHGSQISRMPPAHKRFCLRLQDVTRLNMSSCRSVARDKGRSLAHALGSLPSQRDVAMIANSRAMEKAAWCVARGGPHGLGPTQGDAKGIGFSWSRRGVLL